MEAPAAGFVCPTVLEWMLAQTQKPRPRMFRSRFRSLTFVAPLRTPIEQLAEVNQPPRELGEEHVSLQILVFDVPVVVVARSASVIDWSDPKRRLPGNGLRLFRARVESSHGDQLDVSRRPAGPVGECFWGTGSRPAVITGGLFYDPGASMLVRCLPRIPDIEVELGFWTLESYEAPLRY